MDRLGKNLTILCPQYTTLFCFYSICSNGSPGTKANGVKKKKKNVLRRLAKTQVVSAHLRRVFRETKHLQDTVLTNDDLEQLTVKLSPLDLEDDNQDEGTTYYKPVPKAEFPVIDWNQVYFSEWTEGYNEEPRRIEHTMQSVSNRLWNGYSWDNKNHSWVQGK